MLLHHIATLILTGGMMANNALRVGVVIAWVHDIADVPISFSQLLSNLRLGNVTAVTFLSAVVIWFYTRLIVFPWLTWTTYQYYILPASFDASFKAIPQIKLFLLCMLIVLHVFWFVLFVKLLV